MKEMREYFEEKRKEALIGKESAKRWEEYNKNQEKKRKEDRTCSECKNVAGVYIETQARHIRPLSKFVRQRPYDTVPDHYIFGEEYEKIDVFKCQHCGHIWYISRGYRKKWDD